jgi:hypothetical protein
MLLPNDTHAQVICHESPEGQQQNKAVATPKNWRNLDENSIKGRHYRTKYKMLGKVTEGLLFNAD